jgi:thiol-disulfide isomerase/thioredoxin
MDRLPALMLAAALASGCDDGETVSNESRFVAVTEVPEATPSLADFCEAQPDDARFALPPLEGGNATATGWRWINVWATWCAPCVEELPLLRRWERDLRAEGTAVSLVFVSADRDAEAIERFRAEHPDAPTLRLADPSALPSWVTTVGLDDGAPLPLHVFVDPNDRVRCARAAAVSPDDFETIRYLITR